MTTARLRHKPAPGALEAVKILDVHLRLAGYSRRWLATQSGVPERTLADWWYGRGDPHFSLLNAALGVFELRLKVGGIEKARVRQDDQRR